jgi:hypothetical protein
MALPLDRTGASAVLCWCDTSLGRRRRERYCSKHITINRAAFILWWLYPRVNLVLICCCAFVSHSLASPQFHEQTQNSAPGLSSIVMNGIDDESQMAFSLRPLPLSLLCCRVLHLFAARSDVACTRLKYTAAASTSSQWQRFNIGQFSWR